jgi:hypothetical protein
MNTDKKTAHSLALDLVRYVGWQQFDKSSAYSKNFHQLFGNGEGASISFNGQDMASVYAASGPDVQTIEYVSQRFVSMSDEGWDREYDGVTPVLEIKMDLSGQTVQAIHHRLDDECDSPPHTYPLLSSLDAVLEGYFAELDQTKHLMEILRNPTSYLLAQFNAQQWSMIHQEWHFPFLGGHPADE